MYNDYIKEKVSEKIDYDFNLIRDYIIIYLNMLIKFYSKEDIRIKLNEFIKNYYKFSLNEYKLLRYIKNIPDNYDMEDMICDVFEELEIIYNKHHEYIEMVLNGYEECIFYNDITRTYFRNMEFDINYLIEKEKEIKSDKSLQKI
ncbi:MAG: hypothetical protein IKN63_00475 [Bacilli bacterium]|nr:hypothetical protein [Bacilli bacterium]